LIFPSVLPIRCCDLLHLLCSQPPPILKSLLQVHCFMQELVRQTANPLIHCPLPTADFLSVCVCLSDTSKRPLGSLSPLSYLGLTHSTKSSLDLLVSCN
jgi:hypothetical protein